ncbi:EF-P beta-lysylation protein EpmB [Candidatus Halobeggiatoa sp. HSG11]|nr:EF-P beta-lysylation protein EpmB [Candidatus Halobeggiatoa sp. HSG11]
MIDWQSSLRQAIRNPAHLLELLELPDLKYSTRGFGLLVPKGYVKRMHKGDPNDPLLRQILPLPEENQQVEYFSNDPVGDIAAEKIPGLLQKYHGRVLLVLTTACAIHCRYCFRQHTKFSISQYQAILANINSDPSITEVILSGGDPLILPDDYLDKLINSIAKIPHIKRLRIHTRLPIVLPERINSTLLAALTQTRLQLVIVVHVNHANEIDANVKQILQSLLAAGITLFNQSVLLRGINDNITALANLSEALFNCGVLPYYLHLLDRVQGAAHFEVPESQAIELLKQMQVQLPGYLVPKMVREVAGAAYKQPIEITY